MISDMSQVRKEIFKNPNKTLTNNIQLLFSNKINVFRFFKILKISVTHKANNKRPIYVSHVFVFICSIC